MEILGIFESLRGTRVGLELVFSLGGHHSHGAFLSVPTFLFGKPSA